MSGLANVKVMPAALAARPIGLRLSMCPLSCAASRTRTTRVGASELARWGGAFAHVLAFTRADGTVEHIRRRLVQFPPGLRGRVQVCRRCRRLVFHVVSIDYCSPECAEG